MIRCAQCGHDNLPSHLYCAKCKARMNLNDISPESILRPDARASYPGRALIGVFILIVAVIASALWPEQLDPVRLSGSELAQAREKVKLLQKKDAATEPAVFTGQEVTMLFNCLLMEAPRKPESGARRGSFSAARVTIGPRELKITVNYSMGPWMPVGLNIGPFPLTYTVAGVLENKAEGLCFNAKTGAIGHLPLSFLGRKMAMARLARLFQPFTNARVFLSGLEMIEMKNNSIKVAARRKM